MTDVRSFLLPIAIGVPLTFYGWWCFFRTESAAKFPMNIFYPQSNWMASIQFGVTKIHGVAGLIAGPALVIYGLYAAIRMLFARI